MDLGNNASRESRHQELKHCKIVEVPKFDVNKNSIINLNSPTFTRKQQPAAPPRKKVTFKAQSITLAGPSAELATPAVKSITLADLGAKSLLEDLSDMEWEGSENSYGSAQIELPQFEGDDDSRMVSIKRPQPPSPTVKAWHFGSKELDLDAYHKNKRRIPAKDRLEQPNTYASKLKGPAPEPCAKPLEQPLRFLKRKNNIVKRYILT